MHDLSRSCRLQAPAALSLVCWSRKQTLPGRSKLSWKWVGGAAWAGLKGAASGEEEEEVERKSGPRLGTYSFENPEAVLSCSSLNPPRES